MTKREKISILMGTKKLITKKGCLCHALGEASGEMVYTWSAVNRFAELGVTLPEMDDNGYCFSVDEDGNKQRAALIDRAIKKLQPKKK